MAKNVHSSLCFRYGLECLFRFYSYGLEKHFRDDIYKDFQEETLADVDVNQLYGLEKFWAFLKYYKKSSSLTVVDRLKEKLEKYKNIEDFRVEMPYECDAEKEARKRRIRTRSENQGRAQYFDYSYGGYHGYGGGGRKRRVSEGDEAHHVDDRYHFMHNRARKLSGSSGHQATSRTRNASTSAQWQKSDSQPRRVRTTSSSKSTPNQTTTNISVNSTNSAALSTKRTTNQPAKNNNNNNNNISKEIDTRRNNQKSNVTLSSVTPNKTSALEASTSGKTAPLPSSSGTKAKRSPGTGNFVRKVDCGGEKRQQQSEKKAIPVSGCKNSSTFDSSFRPSISKSNPVPVPGSKSS